MKTPTVSEFILRLIFTTLVLSGCSTDDNEHSLPAIPGDLVSAPESSGKTVAEINSALSLITATNFTGTYNITKYKLIYKTRDTTGNLVNASGTLTIPQKSQGNPSPLLSINHGTIASDNNAPSRNIQAISISSIAASLGYVVTVPDYLGYGESADLLHPYMHAESLASSTTDLIRAAKTYLTEMNIPVNNQLFLTGYSEGGYAALATHRYIQENLMDELTVTASVPAAGAYDFSETARHFAALDTQPSSANLAFVLKAYDMIYGLNRIHDIFVQIPTDIASIVDTAYDGQLTMSEIENVLPADTIDLLDATFLTAFRGSGETELKNRFVENNLDNWVPVAPTRLYHGMDDEIVPAFNAQNTLDAILALDPMADVAIESCIAIPATHSSCSYPALIFAAEFFGNYAMDL